MIDCYSKISKEAKRRNKDIGDLYEGGIQTLLMLNDVYLIVGAGDGTVELIEILKMLPPVKTTTTKCSSRKGPLTNSYVVKMPNKPRVKTVKIYFKSNLKKEIQIILKFDTSDNEPECL